MARIVGYIAQSLDGYIADKSHKVDWLDRFGTIDYGPFSFDQFIKNIGTVVMGRKTFDFIINSDADWPYKEQRAIVVTSKELPREIDGVEVFGGDLTELIADLRKQPKDCWVVGGGQLQSTLIAQGLMDEIEIFVMPLLIGQGIPMWPGVEMLKQAKLTDCSALEAGVVHLQYRFAAD